METKKGKTIKEDPNGSDFNTLWMVRGGLKIQ